MDKKIHEEILQGEGRWYLEVTYEDEQGNQYIVWEDRNGDEKFICEFRKDVEDVFYKTN